MRTHGERGFSYVELVVSMAVLLLGAVALWGGLTTSLPLAGALRGRTTLLNRAQTEMETLRGIPFSGLATYQINDAEAVGEVRVDLLSARRKRVVVSLEHPRYLGRPLVLVTDVHQQGLNP